MDTMDEMIQYLDPSDVSASDLRAMAQQAFSDAFAHLYEHDPFVEFLHKTYGPGGSMELDLRDPTIHWRVAVFDGCPIGYVKVSPLTAPAPSPKSDALELRQIYVLHAWHGRGVADCLMNWALDHARSRKATEIYLTVFDHNTRAKRFYSRHGFSEVGRCTFTLGNRIDDDRVWRKML
jgi:ribosomal protein S18 acetylase RimI-like enzyme